jgi:hypothetical protein
MSLRFNGGERKPTASLGVVEKVGFLSRAPNVVGDVAVGTDDTALALLAKRMNDDVKANGPALVASLRHQIGCFIEVTPEGGKVSRAAAAAARRATGSAGLRRRSGAHRLYPCDHGRTLVSNQPVSSGLFESQNPTKLSKENSYLARFGIGSLHASASALTSHGVFALHQLDLVG